MARSAGFSAGSARFFAAGTRKPAGTGANRQAAELPEAVEILVSGLNSGPQDQMLMIEYRRVKQRFISLVLLLLLTGGTLSGVPLQSGASECDMHGMMDMECCRTALLQKETPEVADAKLCCALNCAQNGTTPPPNAVRVAPPAPASVLPYPAIPQSVLNAALQFPHLERAHGPPGSPPAYLLNLAFLI